MIWGFTSGLGKMDCYGLSEPGRVQPTNSDQFLVADLKRSLIVHRSSVDADDSAEIFGGTKARLLMVADGLGPETGHRASAIALDTIADYFLNSAPLHDEEQQPCDQQLLAELERSFHECRARLQAESAAHPDLHDMGTTITLAYVHWPRMYIAHAGDSRCYLFRDGRLEQITHDHTFAQRMVEMGILEASRAGRSQWNRVLWNIVGTGSTELQPEVREVDLKIGDALLLCTDGLTQQVSDKEIVRILGLDADARTTCRALLDAATREDGDNMTAIVARFRSIERMQSLMAETSEEEDLPEQQSVPPPKGAAKRRAPAVITEPLPAEPLIVEPAVNRKSAGAAPD